MATGDSLSDPKNTDLMLNLEHDQLTFTFPEIAWQLTALLERHIQQLRPKFHLPEDRSTLVEALRRFLHSNSEGACLEQEGTSMDKVLKENEKQICQRCEDFRG